MNEDDVQVRQRVTTLRRVLPLTMALIVVVYQLVLARWVDDIFGETAHFGVEILFYATVGPLITYWALKLVDRWLEEKERAEREAGISERRLASITSASADAILSVGPHGLIESWNRGAELLFGYTVAEIYHQPLSILIGSGDATQVEFRWLEETVQQEGFVRGYETVCHDAGGGTVNVELTATLLPTSNGELPSMSIILRDITNRKRREEEIRSLNASLNEQVAARTHELAEKVAELAQANVELKKLDQMRSEFISLVSHQVRAPLTNMSGAVQRMQAGCAAVNSTCAGMFAIIEQQTARLDRLVQDVLNASRLETGDLLLQPEPVSIPPLVLQVVEQARARTAGRVIRIPAKTGLPMAFVDRDRVAEVLTNLLDNADKYSPADQEIEVKVRANQIGVTVTVRDSGPGLPAGDLERVFGKFYRTDSSDSQNAYGYGLGLYVCQQLIEAQGGHIWAENHPSGGALFSFTLPLWQENYA